MQRYKFQLGPGLVQLISAQGTYIRVVSIKSATPMTAPTLAVRTDTNIEIAMPPNAGFSLEGTPARQWRLQNTHATATVDVEVIIGMGHYEDSAISASIQIADAGVSNVLGGMAYFAGSSVLCPATGWWSNYVENQAGSGVNCVIDVYRLWLPNYAPQTVNMNMAAGVAPKPNFYGVWKWGTPKLAGAAASTKVKHGQDVGTTRVLAATGNSLDNLANLPPPSFMGYGAPVSGMGIDLVNDSGPIIIPPGYHLTIGNGAAGPASAVYAQALVQWREVPL